MREFIETMRERGLVQDIEEQVDIRFETSRRAAGTSDLLYFHKVRGGRAVMNVTASRKALSLALGISERDMVTRLSCMGNTGRVVEDGEVDIARPDLSRIPVMTHFPGDAGPYITAGIVFARYDGVENASIHRMLVLGGNRVAARIVEGRHTHTMLRAALERNERLPVAVAIGVHPAVTFASCTRVPCGMELSYAAELLGGEIRVKRMPNGVLVPEAEILLEGSIGPERTAEGPFVDITGTYDIVRQEPVIEFSGMTLAKDFVYHGILPGGDEHKLLMGAPYEPMIFRAVAAVTCVRNVVLTKGGCGYLHAVIQVRKATEGDAKNAIMAAFASHTSLKHVVVVDEDIDPYDPVEVEYAVATRVRGDRDLLVVSGVRGSSLDPCRLENGTNVKVGVDATMEIGREEKFRRAGWE
ncbi:MAG: UbiD family decarboxylase [Methanoregulaceae archaeon]|nr:UbiD family decarboxylase [Methanoregulaceae archaeon]